MNSTVHTTAPAMPTQLVFGRDAMSNASFQAAWQFIKEQKWRLVIHDNERENAECKPHVHNVGNVAAVKAGTGCKHGSDPHLDPLRITQANDNGTVKLVKVANNGRAVSHTWNIQHVEPRMAWSPRCDCHMASQDAATPLKAPEQPQVLLFPAFHTHFLTHPHHCHGGEHNAPNWT